MSRWTHGICRECWTRREGLRVPVRAREAPAERCCFCGGVADEGIYVREDPSVLPCGGAHGPATGGSA